MQKFIQRSFLISIFSLLAQAGSVFDIQPYKVNYTVKLADGNVNILDLNSKIGAWFLIKINVDGSFTKFRFSSENIYNVENPDPLRQKVSVETSFPEGLVITNIDKSVVKCTLWSNIASPEIAAAIDARKAFTPLCSGKLSLKTQLKGTESWLEWGSNGMKSIHGGFIVDAYKAWYPDRDRKEGEEKQAKKELEAKLSANSDKSTADQFPPRAAVKAENNATLLRDPELSVEITGLPESNNLLAGAWYATKNVPGVFVSTYKASYVPKDILSSYADKVSSLSGEELGAVADFFAFDLDKFNVGWGHGTDHPGFGWSYLAPEPHTGEGPDGFGNIAPLVKSGAVDSYYYPKLIATFSGGFQRRDSAFRNGDLSKNNGSHYGFVENGVILSKLWPGLATFIMYLDGSVQMKTWEAGDNEKLLPTIRFARQNGVPLLDSDPKGGVGIPGSYVNKGSAGNWSGGRSSRAGTCLVKNGNKRFLLYGFFSSATPNAMARVFQAYHCDYAIHLDMNSKQHTYIAIISASNTHKTDANFKVETLIDPMKEVTVKAEDADGKTIYLPRYVLPDYRDFFYVTEK